MPFFEEIRPKGVYYVQTQIQKCTHDYIEFGPALPTLLVGCPCKDQTPRALSPLAALFVATPP